MRNLKFSIIIIAVAIIIVLAAATIVESVNGTQFAHQNIYGSVWFLALWTVFTVVATAYILKRKLYRRINVFLIHASFLVILLGALLSWTTAQSGTIHLRLGEATNTWLLMFILSCACEFREKRGEIAMTTATAATLRALPAVAFL